MQNIGFVKLHRKIRDNPIFWKPNYLAVFIYILLDVEFQKCKKPLRGDLIDLNPGEGLFFQKEISDKFGISIGTVSNILKKLFSENIIEIKTNSKYTIIGLINWELYQGELENTFENELKTSGKRVENELKHLKNTNKTKNTKKRVTRAKKIEIEPEKEEVEKLVHLLPAEIESTKAIYGTLYKKALLKLSSHKESKNVKYSSDYATLHRGGWVYDYMIEKYPTLKGLQESDEKKEEKKEKEKKIQEEKKEVEEKYEIIRAFYSALSEEEKKLLNELADYELRNFTPKMRETAGKEHWKEVYGAKLRAVTDIYRITGEIETVPKEEELEESFIS